MEQKHVIIGTAGHVDHGKTALIQALTGYDCDTHQEEKKRGITINLGFTHLDLDETNSVGIIDVPGHADFINTMIAGAAGIDFVLLVIAADEGIMPQTFEHLEIMKLLKINSGFIVLSKVDLVDEELIELAEEEIREFTKGSFLEKAPILPFSKMNNEGLAAIKNQIKKLSFAVSDEDRQGVFRLYIDRIFSVQGFGTIVNGSALSGKITFQDTLFLHPGNSEIRIRNLQRHGKDVPELVAGDRGSLNIVGLKKSDFQRGMLLASKLIAASQLLDVKIVLFQESKPLSVWSQVIFLLQTYKLMVKVHLLDKDSLQAGKSGLAQVYLPKEIVCLIGDCFIIRDSSDTFTLGGGEVIDPYPLHHRRRKKEHVEQVKELSQGEISNFLENTVRKTIKPILQSEIFRQINIPLTHKKKPVSSLSEDIKVYNFEKDALLIQKKIDAEIRNKIIRFIKKYHTEFPIFESGRTLQEIKGLLNDKAKSEQLYLDFVLQDLQQEGVLKNIDNTWVLSSHKAAFSKQNSMLLAEVENFYKKAKGKIIQQADLEEEFSSFSERDLKMIITYLVTQDKLIKVDYYYFHADFMKFAQEKLVTFLHKNRDSGVKVAEYRDLIAGNRRLAMLLLDYFEKIKVVENQNNVRFLKMSSAKL